MKIAVMGTGALGGYFGGRLLDAGEDVSFIARGANLDALRRTGLRIESPLGDLALPPVVATEDPAEIGPVDLVMFLVKLYDTEAAAEQIKPLLGPETAVVSFQNGVDGWDRIGAVIGRERVVGGVAKIPADLKAPGVVRHNGAIANLTFGEFDRSRSPRLEALHAALKNAGVDAKISDRIDVTIWAKFVFLTALSACTALMRAPIGPILADPEGRNLLRAAIDETFAVGKIECPELGDGVADASFATCESLPPSVRASMAEDLERGKRLELRDLSGAVVRLGEKHGVPTPTHRIAAQALNLYADGAPT